MKISEKTSDWIMIYQVVGWVGAVVASMLDFAWVWFFFIIPMPLTLILNGSQHNGVYSKKLFTVPFLCYAVTYTIAMIGEVYFHVHFLNVAPTFTILGMHPSEFFLYFFYWIGGMLSIGVGLAVKANDWCPKTDWDEFLAVIEKEGMIQ